MKDYLNAFRLDGKVALVTRAARGLGAEIAAALAQAGASVMVSDLLLDEGRATVARIERAGGKARFVAQDVTDEEQWERAVAATVEQMGGIDVLVNNAGIEMTALLAECPVEDFRLQPKKEDI